VRFPAGTEPGQGPAGPKAMEPPSVPACIEDKGETYGKAKKNFVEAAVEL